MNSKIIKLIPFTKDHYEILKDEVTDAKFLMQWAGPKYSFPLTWEQMKIKIDEEINCQKLNRLFSVKIINSATIIGHVQLTTIDHVEKIMNIGSVLVFSKFRKEGFCKEILKEALDIVFTSSKMNELRLGVFDFNKVALNCYKKMGFKEFKFDENAIEIEGDKWNSIRMKITRTEYEEIKKMAIHGHE